MLALDRSRAGGRFDPDALAHGCAIRGSAGSGAR